MMMAKTSRPAKTKSMEITAKLPLFWTKFDDLDKSSKTLKI